MKKTFRRIATFIATAIMAVSCGTTTSFASEANASLTLVDASGIAGKSVTVDLVLDTGNTCKGYNIDVTFDDRLELTNISGAFSSEIIGNVATVINLTGEAFKDGKAVSSLTFEIPKDAVEGETFDVEVTSIVNFCDGIGEYSNPVIEDATITVLETAKRVTNHMVYKYEEQGVATSKVALRGDANFDGRVDLYDSILIAKKMISVMNLDNQQSFFADVNQDGVVNLYDAVAICRFGLASDKNNAWGSII